MATDARLLAEVAGLRRVVEELVEGLTSQVEAEVAAKTIPRAELKSQLRRSFWRTVLVTVAVVVLAVGINRVTLVQSRQDLAKQVTTCFLRPSAITTQQAASCDELFTSDDHAYLKLQEQSRQATQTFVRLQQRMARLEAEVQKLLE